jgi:adenosylhomocysteine nucleosidase
VTGNTFAGTGNQGVMNTGSGTVNISGTAIGNQARVSNAPQPGPTADRPALRKGEQWDIGVITVLSEETRAVARMLARAGSYAEQARENRLLFAEAVIAGGGQRVRVVATQALDRGPRSVGIAFDHLRRYYAPGVVVLTGIAGGIHPSVQLGDVVVAQEVIYYDHRKVTAAGIRRRGTSQPVPALVRRAVNKFFSDTGEPSTVTVTDPDGAARTFKVLPGPIGSGDAVVADADSEIRSYLSSYNDNTLAVETEAGGLSQAFYEKVSTAETDGWLVIRGISDDANAAKDDSCHDIAAWHAAAVLEALACYLKPGS